MLPSQEELLSYLEILFPVPENNYILKIDKNASICKSLFFVFY